MMTDKDRREEDLINLTRKGAPDVATRVLYTLTDDRKIARAIARLVTLLHEKGNLSGVEIDDMLLEAAGRPAF
jgi:hypothetical protein